MRDRTGKVVRKVSSISELRKLKVTEKAKLEEVEIIAVVSILSTNQNLCKYISWHETLRTIACFGRCSTLGPCSRCSILTASGPLPDPMQVAVTHC